MHGCVAYSFHFPKVMPGPFGLRNALALSSCRKSVLLRLRSLVEANVRAARSRPLPGPSAGGAAWPQSRCLVSPTTGPGHFLRLESSPDVNTCAEPSVHRARPLLPERR